MRKLPLSVMVRGWILACSSKVWVTGRHPRLTTDSWLCLPSDPYQDLTDSSSFERAKFWVKELRSLEEVGGQILQVSDRDSLGLCRSSQPCLLLQGCQIYLCGTKSDLLEEDRRRRRVDFHDVQDYADSSCYKVF